MIDRDVEITIDEVLLDAPFGARAPALREALAAHLRRLLAERGAPAATEGGDLRLPRAVFDVPSDLGTDAIGALVARGIHERLAGARGGGR